MPSSLMSKRSVNQRRPRSQQHTAASMFTGRRLNVRGDPPSLNLAKWNTATVFMRTSATTSVGYLTVGNILAAFRTQMGLGSVSVLDDALLVRFLRIKAWYSSSQNTATGFDSGDLNIGIYDPSNFGASTNSVPMCALTDTGSLANLASVGFQWPERTSSFQVPGTAASRTTTIFSLCCPNSGGGDTVILHIDVLWRFIGSPSIA
jgi:hypothetical protein